MKFILNKDNLNIEGSQIFNSGSTGYYEIDVEYDEEWKGLTIAVVMIKKGERVGKNISVVNDKVCIDRAVYGSYFLGVIGYKTENQQIIYQISTNLMPVYFNKGAGEIETQNEDIPTASEWKIYLEQLKTIVDDIKLELNEEVSIIVDEELKKKLETGEFNGESAYQVAVNNGFKGTEKEWLDSLEGNPGKNGATFTPNVDNDGNLSWTNDGNLENPGSVNIKGYTPVRGTDYWTETDVEEIKTYCNDYIDTQITQVIGGAY